MNRILLVMLGLLSAWHTVTAAAPWNLPAGVKTVEVNGYPMAFLEAERANPSYSCMVGERTIELGDDRWNHRRAALGSLR